MKNSFLRYLRELEDLPQRTLFVCLASFCAAVVLMTLGMRWMTFAHELGHATAARMAGLTVNGIFMPYLVPHEGWNGFGFRWEHTVEADPFTRIDLAHASHIQAIFTIAAGPLADVLATFVFLWPLIKYWRRLHAAARVAIAVFAVGFTCMVLVDLNPFYYGNGRPTDGTQIRLHLSALIVGK